MRSLLAIFLGFVLLISLSVFTFHKLEESYSIIKTDLDQAQEYIAAEKWREAENLTRKIDAYWTETKKWWAILLDHEALDDIEISIKRLETFIETKEKPSSLAELETLKVLVKKVPESECLRLNNIL
ncbi:hypothetical protein Sgly_1850 [Syntrophobotulus glycolicus DSM 8271]|uniref:DUF4363 domain-containing protein n=1 Tax=Syntrophobotulus glycolicus (strain DSM 8271 / FlGlyR) TaxID=645991 RepID=F0T060_SYNGF|nr:DUF4363 family protein [Syntrophobotulus glycolicus]ADY56147.1 hypothetical protein Sgly_1850 [Syntrophobotulus glycolicus DSM 8271]